MEKRYQTFLRICWSSFLDRERMSISKKGDGSHRFLCRISLQFQFYSWPSFHFVSGWIPLQFNPCLKGQYMSLRSSAVRQR